MTEQVSGIADGVIEIGPAGSGVWHTLPTQMDGSRLVARVDDAALPLASTCCGRAHEISPATKPRPTGKTTASRW